MYDRVAKLTDVKMMQPNSIAEAIVDKDAASAAL
jgi:hypothetical protein